MQTQMNMDYFTGHVLPTLATTDLRHEDGESTMAVGQACRTLYDLAVCGGIAFPGYEASDCVRLARRADDQLAQCLHSELHPRKQARLLHARYDLLRATADPFDDDALRRDDDCRHLAHRLFFSATAPDAPTETALCRCALDVLCPAPEADPGLHTWLSSRLRQWAAGTDATGRWPGLDPQTAAERIEVFHEYAFMLLDDTYAPQLRRLRTAYAGTFRATTATTATTPAVVRLWLTLYRLHFATDYRPDHTLACRLRHAAADDALPRALRLAAMATAAHTAADDAIRDVQERLAV